MPANVPTTVVSSALPQNPIPDRVFGQNNNFNYFDPYHPSGNRPSDQGSLYGPQDICVDPLGNVYISDTMGNRVLYYPSGSTTPTRVYGQGASGTDFNTNEINKGGISACSLYYPSKITLDLNGNLYVCDTYNNRVLFFEQGDVKATKVYGQSDNFTTRWSRWQINNASGVNFSTLNTPQGVLIDNDNDIVYIADTQNHRIVSFFNGSTTASAVLGQPTSEDNLPNNNLGNNRDLVGQVDDYNLNCPTGMALDSLYNLYVSDCDNHRVLCYHRDTIQAIRVYGQGAEGTNFYSARKDCISEFYDSSPDPNFIEFPSGLAIDADDNLYVCDVGHDRILFFPKGSTMATGVFGQRSLFGYTTSFDPAATNLKAPRGIALDTRGNLYVADTDFGRALRYIAMTPTISLDVVRQFCPAFRFHSKERHFPCSIEYLLTDSILRDNTDPDFGIRNPTQNDLYTHWEGNERFFVDINDLQNSGGEEKRLYYCARPVSSDIGNCFAITYILLYAWQNGQVADVNSTRANAAIGAEPGAITIPLGPFGILLGALGSAVGATVGAIAGDFEAILSNYGEHQGDLERVTVGIRSSGDSSSEFSIVGVTYEQHGDAISYLPEECDFIESTHPIAAIGLGQHPTYNPKDVGYHEARITIQDLLVFKIVDAISSDGPEWQPWTGKEALIKVGLRDGEPINDQIWAKFQGRFGIFSKPHLDHAIYLDGSNLDDVHWNSLKIIAEQVEEVDRVGTHKPLIPSENGPNGLNGRAWMVLPSLKG